MSTFADGYRLPIVLGALESENVRLRQRLADTEAQLALERARVTPDQDFLTVLQRLAPTTDQLYTALEVRDMQAALAAVLHTLSGLRPTPKSESPAP